MNELNSFSSDRIYHAVEQAELAAGDIDILQLDDNQFYLKSEVDAVVDKLNHENERLVKCCKEYDARQCIDERIKFSCAQQLRATKRALWLARAKRNRDLRMLGNFRKYAECLVKPKPSIYYYPTKGFPGTRIHKWMMDSFETWCKYFKIAEDKCLKKAEEYK